MIFGNWNEEIHKDLEQIKRIIFMKRIKNDAINLDSSSQTAQITGTDGIYDVSLNSCTCFDFESRQLPCKHMYRLAFELDIISDLPSINRKAAKEFKNNLPNEIERFKDYYLNGAISGEKFNKIINALNSK